MQAFAPNVWIIDGPTVRDFGVLFTTRMTVVSLADGSVWIDSPVSVPFETLKRTTELGQVRYLVAETPRHVWRLAAWHTLFPDAQLWAPRPTPLTLKKGHLPLTGVLKDTEPRDWSLDFDQLAFKGNPLIEEVLFFHQASRYEQQMFAFVQALQKSARGTAKSFLPGSPLGLFIQQMLMKVVLRPTFSGLLRRPFGAQSLLLPQEASPEPPAGLPARLSHQ